MLRVIACVTEQHDLRLVIVAALICLLACFTSLTLHGRAGELPTGRVRLLWLTGAAAVFGSGVWTTHFVAMLAFRPSLPIGYDIGLTLLSVVVAIAIGWLGLRLALCRSKLAVLGGGIVGAAVGSMHYVGMAAMRVPAVVQWDAAFVVASVIIGITVSGVALPVAARCSTSRQRAIGSSLLALSIVGLHFTAMAAAVLVPDPLIPLPDRIIAPEWLAVAVTAVTTMIMALGLLAWAFDRQLVERAARLAELESVKRQLEATAADLTSALAEQKKVEVELRQAHDNLKAATKEHEAARIRAEVANRAKSDFLACMSHELRTPLNSILGFSDVMKSELFGSIGSAQYRGYVLDIHDSGTHLLTLINDLLDLAKIEAGKSELFEERCDVADIVESSVHLMNERAHNAGVSLSIESDRHLPLLHGDERKIRQILFNLLSNAIKFTPAGGRVTVRAGIDNDLTMRLAVMDTGIGIPPDQIERVLEPFTQVENVYSRTHNGTGLGLPLCRELARLHDARLTLMSELGAGTSVTIVFPKERTLPGSQDGLVSAA